MKVEKGTVADSLYIQLSDQPISHTIEITEDVAIDIGENGLFVGLDIQHLSALWQNQEQEGAEHVAAPELRVVPA